MLRCEQERRQENRQDTRPAFQHSDGNDLRRTCEHKSRQPLPLGRSQTGIDRKRSGQQPPWSTGKRKRQYGQSTLAV